MVWCNCAETNVQAAKRMCLTIAKISARKVKWHRGGPYRGMVLMSSVLISILYGCGPAASKNHFSSPGQIRPVPFGREQSTMALPAGQGREEAVPVASTSNLPDWMQAALKHPDPEVRLKALEKWIEEKRAGVGPAMMVIDDPDERVRAKAMQLIERDWATEQRAIQNMR